MIKIFLLTFALAMPEILYAAIGCLTQEEELVPRATIILIGQIEKLGVAHLTPCPPAVSLEVELNRRYEKCGDVTSFTVAVKQRVKGDVPDRSTILVASEGLLGGNCDDRPPVEKMVGREALFFLEDFEGNLWTLDGPDSIYIGGTAARVLTIMRTERMRLIIETDHYSAFPGQSIVVTHRLTGGERSSFYGCFGGHNWWRFENPLGECCLQG